MPAGTAARIRARYARASSVVVTGGWRFGITIARANCRAVSGNTAASDSSSRHLRDRQFWSGEGLIQPGKVAGWIFATEEKGARMK